MNCTTIITRQRLSEGKRLLHTARLFGIHFPLLVEPFVYAVTESMSNEYEGGYWEFYKLGNGGFYMAPTSNRYFPVKSMNGYEGILSADALGITACLYTYSNLSYLAKQGLAEKCAEQYYLLRDFMFEQPEAEAILGAID